MHACLKMYAKSKIAAFLAPTKYMITTKQEEKKPIEPVGGTECRSVEIKELKMR